jgi:hypothetical protein
MKCLKKSSEMDKPDMDKPDMNKPMVMLLDEGDMLKKFMHCFKKPEEECDNELVCITVIPECDSSCSLCEVKPATCNSCPKAVCLDDDKNEPECPPSMINPTACECGTMVVTDEDGCTHTKCNPKCDTDEWKPACDKTVFDRLKECLENNEGECLQKLEGSGSEMCMKCLKKSSEMDKPEMDKPMVMLLDEGDMLKKFMHCFKKPVEATSCEAGETTMKECNTSI